MVRYIYIVQMITIKGVVNTSIPSCDYHLYFAVLAFRICSLSTSGVYSTILLTIRSAELIHLFSGSLYLFTKPLLFTTHSQPPATIILLSLSMSSAF